jgi:hypothetical protein
MGNSLLDDLNEEAGGVFDLARCFEVFGPSVWVDIRSYELAE